MLNLNNYFSKGQNNTIKLQKDFSIKNPWIQIHTDTVIDSWYVGDFSSATYFITVEYDSNQKETMQVLVVARPAQATFSIFGRTTIEDELIDISASVTNSQLILSATANSGFDGAKLTFTATYIETIQPLTTPTTVTIPPINSILVPPVNTPSYSFGKIAVSGQSDVFAQSPTDNLNFVAGSGISITTNNAGKSITLSSSFPFYKNLQVAGQSTLIPSGPNTNLTYSGTNGISITTNVATNTISFGLGTISTLSVSGAITASSTLTTSGLLTANAGATVNNSLTVNNGSTLNNGATVNSGLTVNGTTTLTGALLSSSTISTSLDVSASRNVGAFNYGTLSFSDTNILSSLSSSVNSYNQLVLENTNSGSNASADIVVCGDSGLANSYYGNFGMNGSGWTGTLGTNSLNAANIVYLASSTSDLILGTFTNNSIRFCINNGTDSVRIDTSSVLNALRGFNSSSTTTINPANANVTISPSGTGSVSISPSGTGTVTINPTSTGSIDNITIGGTSPRAGTFTTIIANDSITVTNSITTAAITASGLVDINRSTNTIVDVSSSATVSYNFTLGSSFYHSSTPTIDWTAAFSNLPITNGKVTTVTIIVPQGSPAYKITACTIDSVSTPIKWAGSTTPTGTANKSDVWTFIFVRRSSSWSVHAYLTGNYG